MTINTKTGHVKFPRNTALNSAKEIKKLQTSKNPTLHTLHKIEVQWESKMVGSVSVRNNITLHLIVRTFQKRTFVLPLHV